MAHTTAEIIALSDIHAELAPRVGDAVQPHPVKEPPLDITHKALWGLNHSEAMAVATEDGTSPSDVLFEFEGRVVGYDDLTDDDRQWVAEACRLAAAANEAVEANQLMEEARQAGTLGDDTVIPLRGEDRTIGSLTADDVEYFRVMTQLAIDVDALMQR